MKARAIAELLKVAAEVNRSEQEVLAALGERLSNGGSVELSVWIRRARLMRRMNEHKREKSS